MERKNVEYTAFKTVYVAEDGTEFSSEEQCRKYEDACAINKAFKQSFPEVEANMICNGDYNPLPTSYDDNCTSITIYNADEVLIANKYFALNGGGIKFGTSDIGKTIAIAEFDGEYYLLGEVKSLKRRCLKFIDMFAPVNNEHDVQKELNDALELVSAYSVSELYTTDDNGKRIGLSECGVHAKMWLASTISSLEKAGLIHIVPEDLNKEIDNIIEEGLKKQ